MSNAREDFWRVTPLSGEDQELVNAYVRIGKPLDQLAYTKEFDELVKMLNRPNTEDQKWLVYRRLLQLRKTGRLPRLAHANVELL